jgi:hypothetical protein
MIYLTRMLGKPVLDADGKDTGTFEVPAGGRRFRALELLVTQKRLATHGNRSLASFLPTVWITLRTMWTRKIFIRKNVLSPIGGTSAYANAHRMRTAQRLPG